MMQIDLYVDGACQGNPGPGGYAWTLIAWDPSTEKALKTLQGEGNTPHTTNQRMELLAAIVGLNALTSPATLQVISDSKYLVDGMSSWLAKWQANGWRTSKRTPIENQDLWEQLAQHAKTHRIQWTWTQGHDPGKTRFSTFNNRVNDRAVDERNKAALIARATPVTVEQAFRKQFDRTGEVRHIDGSRVQVIRRQADGKFYLQLEHDAIVKPARATLYYLP